jgi:hypothetical protein
VAENKIKSESYNNLGGINTKVSPYLTGPQEFLDLENFDFTRPGSLTKSPGTTLLALGYTIATAGPSGPVYSSATGPITGLFEFAPQAYLINGVSVPLFIGIYAQGNFLYTMNFVYAQNGSLVNLIGPTLNPGIGLWSFVPFVDYMFCCNGSNFAKWSP